MATCFSLANDNCFFIFFQTLKFMTLFLSNTEAYVYFRMRCNLCDHAVLSSQLEGVLPFDTICSKSVHFDEKIITLPMRIHLGIWAHSVYLFRHVFVYMNHLYVIIIKKTQT